MTALKTAYARAIHVSMEWCPGGHAVACSQRTFTGEIRETDENAYEVHRCEDECGNEILREFLVYKPASEGIVDVPHTY